jgi:hypothetical protein
LAFSWGSQSWLQAGFSPPLGFEASFSGFAAPCPRHTKPKKIRANCATLFSADGGLKAACRHDCLPTGAVDCMPRMAKAEFAAKAALCPCVVNYGPVCATIELTGRTSE